MSIFDTKMFNDNMFFPRKGNGKEAHEIFINVDKEVRVHARRYENEQAKYSIVYFHGNGEIVADYDDIERLYRQIDCELLVCDYRGYGRSDGTPTLRNLLTDSHIIYQYLCDHNLIKEKHFIMGRSLGSAAAIELGTKTYKACGIIIESGYADPIA